MRREGESWNDELAVLGGGNGARAILPDMTLAGFEVSLLEAA